MKSLKRLFEIKKLEEENKQLRKMLDLFLSNPNLVKIIQESKYEDKVAEHTP